VEYEHNFKLYHYRILKEFEELTTAELYAIIQLRNEVFVVEQNCVYQDADGKDQQSLHFCGWDGEVLAAYTRIIPPGISYTEASIGRVVTAPAYRNTGAGRILMEESIKHALNCFNANSIKIGAQCSEEFLEDGIPHIEMILNK